MSQRAGAIRNVALIVLVCLIVPLGLRYNPDACFLDLTFMYMSNALFQGGFVYGRDVLFTHGPLGFFLNPFSNDGLYFGAAAFQGILFIANIVMTVVLMRRLASSALRPLAFLAALFFASYFAWLPTSATPVLYTAIISCVFFAVFRASRGVTLFLNAFFILTSVLFLIKFNTFLLFFLLSLCFIATLLIVRAIKPQSAFLLCVILLVEIAAAYLAYNASFADLWQYIRGSVEIASHYAVAHSLPFGWMEILPPFLLCVFLLLHFMRFAASGAELAFLAAPFSIILFFSLKHAFIRADFAHTPVIFQCLLLVAAWLILLARNSSAFGSACVFFGTTLFCVLLQPSAPPLMEGVQAILQNYNQQNVFATTAEALAPPSGPMKLLAYFERQPQLLHARELAQASPQLDAAMARDIRGKSVSSLFSTFPLLFEIAQGNIRFIPFPIYETYSAYSRRLDDKTADLLENASKAPQFILYPGFDIDGKCPATTTPRTFYALYDHYDLAEYPTAYCFIRRDRPRFHRLAMLSSVTALAYHPIVAPPSRGELLASFALRLNLLGKIRAILGAVPEMYLLIKPEGSDLVSRRIAPDAMNNTCSLNGALYGLDLKRFFQSRGQGPRVEFVAISGDGAKYLQEPFEVNFYQPEAQ